MNKPARIKSISLPGSVTWRNVWERFAPHGVTPKEWVKDPRTDGREVKRIVPKRVLAEIWQHETEVAASHRMALLCAGDVNGYFEALKSSPLTAGMKRREYWIWRRREAEKRFLSTELERLDRIAEAFGYAQPNYGKEPPVDYNRTFKLQYGEKPDDWRHRRFYEGMH